MRKLWRSEPAALLIVAAFAILGVAYSLVTPVFEASDELSHYPVVQYIATHWELPVQRPGVVTLWEQEGSQPPLYYLIAAALTSRIDTSDLPAFRDRNLHAKLGITLDSDNKNMILHTEAEDFPWHGTVLAVHLLRFLGVLLGALSVFLTYRFARVVWPDPAEIALLTASLVAFNPMFLFISGSVNNDNLIIPLATGILLLLAHIMRTGLTVRRSIVLAILCGLAALTKISGLTLLPITGVVLAIVWYRGRNWRPVFAAGGLITLCLAVIAGWWYVRNLQLYHELLGTTMQTIIAGSRTIDLWPLIRDESHGFWVSYWANFGSVDVLADDAVYWFYGILTIVANIGLIVWIVRLVRARKSGELLMPGLLAAQIVVTLLGLIRWTLTTMASQGRLMFAVLAPLSLFTARGLLTLVPSRGWRWSALGIAGVLAAIAAIAPFRYIAPTYAPPPSVAAIPKTATPVGAHWDGLELVAVDTPLATVKEGDWVPITLYWRAEKTMDTRYSVFLHALGQNGEQIGKIDSYPGGGALPTTRMQPGVIVKDTYRVPLFTAFKTPTRIRMLIGAGLFDGKAYQVLPTTKADGSSFGNVVVDAGVAYPSNSLDCSPSHPASARVVGTLGGFARLWSDTGDQTIHPGDSLPVSLYWDRLDATTRNWTVFVQLVGQGNTILAQADSPPLNNDYPTSLWRLPCEVHDVHTLNIPADAPSGEYRLLVGLYDPVDPGFARAAAQASDGSPYTDNAILLATIRMEAE